MAQPFKKVVRRELRTLVDDTERVILRVAADEKRQLSFEEIIGDAWMFEADFAGEFFTEPEYWRSPPRSRRVN